MIYLFMFLYGMFWFLVGVAYLLFIALAYTVAFVLYLVAGLYTLFRPRHPF
jgi:hypothetical protein